jgi:hypothetical protein
MTVASPPNFGIPAPIEVKEDDSDLMTCAFRVPICWVDALDDLADELGTSRAALIRDSLAQTHLKSRLTDEQLVVNTRKRIKPGVVADLTHEAIDAIAETYTRCQLSVDDVARLFGIAYETSRWALSERGVEVNRGPRNINGLTFGAMQRILETPGIETAQLPLVLGLSPQAVGFIVAAQGAVA